MCRGTRLRRHYRDRDRRIASPEIGLGIRLAFEIVSQQSSKCSRGQTRNVGRA